MHGHVPTKMQQSCGENKFTLEVRIKQAHVLVSNGFFCNGIKQKWLSGCIRRPKLSVIICTLILEAWQSNPVPSYQSHSENAASRTHWVTEGQDDTVDDDDINQTVMASAFDTDNS